MSYLEKLLNLYWLRPEVALWRTFDCTLMEKYQILQPSLEMGTGDGVLSYILAGGNFHHDFDVYRLVEKTDNFTKGEDIYNTISNHKPILISNKNKLRHRYTVGIDYKRNMLKKALLIPDFYKTLLQYNLNKPLPFKSESFQTVFSNIIYWLEDLDVVFFSAYNILRKNGRMYIFVPNVNFKQLTWILYQENNYRDYSYLNYINRGYNSLFKHCYSKEKWINIFERNGFNIIDHRQYLSKIIMEIWSVGTRPVSHLLINMSNKLDDKNRITVKSEWINYFYEFFTPLIKFDWECDRVTEPAFHFFVLEKK